MSGPGALSQRTDGGPGNARQPVRGAPQPQHGQRQEIEDAQRAAPLPREDGLVDGPLGPARINGEAPLPGGDAFGEPTMAEGEAPEFESPMLPPGPDEALALLFEIHATADLLRLMQMRRHDNA